MNSKGIRLWENAQWIFVAWHFCTTTEKRRRRRNKERKKILTHEFHSIFAWCKGMVATIWEFLRKTHNFCFPLLRWTISTIENNGKFMGFPFSFGASAHCGFTLWHVSQTANDSLVHTCREWAREKREREKCCHPNKIYGFQWKLKMCNYNRNNNRFRQFIFLFDSIQSHSTAMLRHCNIVFVTR